MLRAIEDEEERGGREGDVLDLYPCSMPRPDQDDPEILREELQQMLGLELSSITLGSA